VLELAIKDEDLPRLKAIARSPEPASWLGADAAGESRRSLVLCRMTAFWGCIIRLCSAALSGLSADLPPKPGKHASFARDDDYKRRGMLSLLAGIDLLTGPCPRQGWPFIEFLKPLDAAHTSPSR
jgi:hypothetical protein